MNSFNEYIIATNVLNHCHCPSYYTNIERYIRKPITFKQADDLFSAKYAELFKTCNYKSFECTCKKGFCSLFSTTAYMIVLMR